MQEQQHVQESPVPTQEITLGVVGSRYCVDWPRFEAILDGWREKHAAEGTVIALVSGGARGVDALAERYASEHAIPMIIHPAEWAKYKARAGPLRNAKIVADVTHLLALPGPDSTGTYDTIRKARTAGVPTTVVKVAT